MPAPDFSSLFTLPKCFQGNLGFVWGQIHTVVHKLYLWSDPAQEDDLCRVFTGSPGCWQSALCLERFRVSFLEQQLA